MQPVTPVIAVADLIGKTVGLITWWRLSGSVEVRELWTAWEAAGLPGRLLPASPSPKLAISRAAAAIPKLTGKPGIPRALSARSRTGWMVIEGGKEQASTIPGDIWGTVVAKLVLQGNALQVDLAPQYADLTDRVLQAFAHAQTILSAVDISEWLTDLVTSLQAVSLRTNGGVYFVPEDGVEMWHRMMAVLQSIGGHGHEIHEINAVRTEKAVEAILASVIHDVDQTLSVLETEVDTMPMKQRALETRRDRCGVLLDKVSTYETLLGRSLGELRQRVEGLQATIVENTLAVSGDD